MAKSKPTKGGKKRRKVDSDTIYADDIVFPSDPRSESEEDEEEAEERAEEEYPEEELSEEEYAEEALEESDEPIETDLSPISGPSTGSTTRRGAAKAAKAPIADDSEESDIDVPLTRRGRPGKAKTTSRDSSPELMDIDSHPAKQHRPSRNSKGKDADVASLASTGSKRKKDLTAAVPRKKRAVYNPPTEANKEQHLSALQSAGLDETWLTQDHRAKNVNRFLTHVRDDGLKQKPDVVVKYEPASAGELQHVLDLPVYKKRNFKLIESRVRLQDVRRSTGTVRAWDLAVRDDATGVTVELFRYPPHDSGASKVYLKDNAIDTNVCQTRNEALRLGHGTAEVMNRVPATLDTAAWALRRGTGKDGTGVLEGPGSGKWVFSNIRSFVDVTALKAWKPDFDYALLSPSFVFPPNTANARTKPGMTTMYGAPLNYTKPEAERGTVRALCQTVTGPPFVLDTGSPYDHENWTLLVYPDRIDPSKVQDVPDGWIFKGNGPPATSKLDLSKANVQAAISLPARICYDLTGMVGTTTQLLGFRDTAIQAALKLESLMAGAGGNARTTSSGSVSGHRLFLQPTQAKNSKKVFIRVSPGVGAMLDTSKFPMGKSHFDVGYELGVHMTSLYRPHHAYVMSQGSYALEGGKSLMNALLDAYQAADAVEMGIVTPEEMYEFYLTRKPDAEVFCWHCCLPRLRSALGVAGMLWICGVCSKLANLSLHGITSTTLSDRIRADATMHLWVDRRAGASTVTIDELTDRLVKTHQVDDTHWKSALGGVMDFTEQLKRREVGLKGNRVAFPFGMSQDKIFVRWLQDGKWFFHHTLNTTLMAWCDNALKAVHSPAALAVFGGSYRLSNSVSTLDPVEGYHPRVAAGMAIVEKASDNIYYVDMLTPHRCETRARDVPTMTDSEYMERIISQQKSGVYDNTHASKAARMKMQGFAFSGRADLAHWHKPSAGRLQFAMWTAREIKALWKNVDDIENDMSLGHNPFGLVIPRCPDGRTPWPFRRDHMPADADMEMMFREFNARLWTWDELCDEENETQESPATLFVEYIVQWFEHAGKCHMFGFIMTYATGHIAVFSYGRAVVAVDEDGNEREVKAGEMMRTGCTVLFPTDMRKHYHKPRRTVIAESGAANRRRLNFSGGKALITQLNDGLTAFPEKTEFYGSLQSLSAYSDVPLPTSWRDRSREIRELAEGGGALELQDEELSRVVGARDLAEQPEEFNRIGASDSVGAESVNDNAAAAISTSERPSSLFTPAGGAGPSNTGPSAPAAPTAPATSAAASAGTASALPAPGTTASRVTDQRRYLLGLQKHLPESEREFYAELIEGHLANSLEMLQMSERVKLPGWGSST
ncbi:hypothetical protein LTR56_018124 [Elasticomyces elasticus]|nr:hypothetical protein LTR56_018124 [Elasticomyces elasticus]KAK4906214.1 hypothetical protein LTR49_024615 [Elasticomyces elasticus]KAK5758032.1 hypothetical protein LTS12_011927 [Elasticomyces elasticus]